jgi:sphingolipid delta-4 desaturase
MAPNIDADEEKKKLNALHIPDTTVGKHWNRDAHDQKRWRDKQPEDFTWARNDEPHVVRRREILKKHPEIMKLYRKDPLSAVFCVCVVTIQFAMAWIVRDWDWIPLILATWIISGTCNHSNVLAMHEVSHDCWFEKRWQNQIMGYIANLPCCIASAATFKRYHLEHHSFQGSDQWDADIPTEWEGRFFTTWYNKLIWVFFQPVAYGLRPLIVKPKNISMGECVNWIVVLTSDLLVIKYMGGKSFFYLLFGTLLGLGPHPMSGHFVAEHFEFIEGQETYSYYGPLNCLAYNVGYHNEHHDFPKVPGRLLPQVREMAPEYYDTMPYYDSWTRVLTDFIFGQNMNCYCRVKRTP